MYVIALNSKGKLISEKCGRFGGKEDCNFRKGDQGKT